MLYGIFGVPEFHHSRPFLSGEVEDKHLGEYAVDEHSVWQGLLVDWRGLVPI